MSERDYSKFTTRLSSYEDPPWPDCGLYTKSLAEAGFVYTGEADIVFCYQCGIKVHQWRGDDDPLLRHKALNEDCIFLQRRLMNLTNVITETNNFNDPREEDTYVYIKGRGVVKKSVAMMVNGCSNDEFSVANPSMCSEKCRYESFATCDPNKNWPTTDTLARHGFYWSDSRRSVVCFCCGCEVQEWEAADEDVQLKHRSISSSCPFVNGYSCGNIDGICDAELDIGIGKLNINEKDDDLPTPNVVVTTTPLPSPQGTPPTLLDSATNRVAMPYTYGRSESRTYAPPMSVPVCSMSTSYPEVNNIYYNNATNMNNNSNQNFTDNNSNNNVPPADFTLEPHERSRAGTLPLSARPPVITQGHPLQRSQTCPVMPALPAVAPPAMVLGSVTLDLSSKSVRLKTFITYPRDTAVKPEELAEAGFYYECRKDLVKCYKCGVMLGSWQPGDSAWEEHRKFSPNCELVIQKFHGLPAQQQLPQPSPGCIPPPTRYRSPPPMLAEQQGYNPRTRPPPLPPDPNPYFDGHREYTPIQQQQYPAPSPSQQMSPLIMNASPVYSPFTPPAYGPQRSQNGSSSSSGPPASPMINPSPGHITPSNVRFARQPSDGNNPMGPYGNFGHVRVGGTPLYILPENFPNTTPTPQPSSNDILLHQASHLIYQDAYDRPPGHGYPAFERQAAAYDPPQFYGREGDMSPQKGAFKNKVGGIGYQRQDGHSSFDEKEEDQKDCKICWERPVEMTLSPCGHLVLCEPCSRNITECPICRREVTSSLRTYFYGN